MYKKEARALLLASWEILSSVIDLARVSADLPQHLEPTPRASLSIKELRPKYQKLCSEKLSVCQDLFLVQVVLFHIHF